MRQIIFIFLVLIVAATSQAQSKEERIKAIKIAFITEELALTAEQSQAFWPIYNEMHEKLRKQRKAAKNKPDVENMSDADLEKWLNQHLQAEEERVNLQRTYVEKFKKIISIRQIVKLTQAERSFKRELLKHAKEHRAKFN